MANSEWRMGPPPNAWRGRMRRSPELRFFGGLMLGIAVSAGLWAALFGIGRAVLWAVR